MEMAHIPILFNLLGEERVKVRDGSLLVAFCSQL